MIAYPTDNTAIDVVVERATLDLDTLVLARGKHNSLQEEEA